MPERSASAIAAAHGVRAARQQRSLHKQQALLAAGRQLLQAQDLPSLTVAQVAAAAGVAVGSFYARFDDKNAWFAELARQAALAAFDDLQRLLSSAAMARAALPRRTALLMAWLVQVHRDHQGLFRAAVSDPARTQGYWVPFTRLRAQVVDQVATQWAADLATLPARGRRARLDFAFQVVFGTLAQAALHDAGPLKLADPALPRELARVFLAALAPPATAAAA